jgi:bifunctional DNase/RNase
VHLEAFGDRRLQAEPLGFLGQKGVNRKITDMTDGVFYAQLVLDSGVEIDSRPSDSIALAMRTGARIVCSEELLDDVGIAVPDEREEEVEKFREFLDHVSPEDFES